MANRIDYEVIAPEAYKLLTKLVSAKSDEEVLKIYRAYKDLLDAGGWDDRSFDQETLERINRNWETKPNITLN